MCNITISAYELIKRFPDDESARLYLERRRWNNTPYCPNCGCMENQYKQKKNGKPGYYLCNHCKLVYTVRTGTIFARSHVPLDKWLYAVYLVVTARKGVSSLQLSKEIGVTQKTAWFMLHRIRTACQDDDNGNFLKGIVEADEAYFDGKEVNKHTSKQLKVGRGTVVKAAVLGMREREGRFKGVVLNDTTAESIQAELNQTIDDEPTLYTKAYYL